MNFDSIASETPQLEQCMEASHLPRRRGGVERQRAQRKGASQDRAAFRRVRHALSEVQEATQTTSNICNVMADEKDFLNTSFGTFYHQVMQDVMAQAEGCGLGEGWHTLRRSRTVPLGNFMAKKTDKTIQT